MSPFCSGSYAYHGQSLPGPAATTSRMCECVCVCLFFLRRAAKCSVSPPRCHVGPILCPTAESSCSMPTKLLSTTSIYAHGDRSTPGDLLRVCLDLPNRSAGVEEPCRLKHVLHVGCSGCSGHSRTCWATGRRSTCHCHISPDFGIRRVSSPLPLACFPSKLYEDFRHTIARATAVDSSCSTQASSCPLHYLLHIV